MASGWKAWDAGCCWVLLPAGCRDAPRRGFGPAVLGFAHFSSPNAKAMGFCTPPGNPFPTFTLLATRKLFPLSNPKPSLPLSEPVPPSLLRRVTFLPSVAAPAGNRQPHRPSPAGQGGCWDTERMEMLGHQRDGDVGTPKGWSWFPPFSPFPGSAPLRLSQRASHT